MEWWVWLIGGLALLGIEVMVPGTVIFLFFGAAAILLGVLQSLGLGGPIWFQWVLFSVLSIVSLLTLRGPILRYLNRRTHLKSDIDYVDSLVGSEVVLTTDLAPGSPGKAALRGSSWSVVGADDTALPAGTRCVVEAVEGLTLTVRAARRAPGGPA